MDVAILIISYNTRNLALACLKSVYEQTSGIDFEVLVVDNQSADGSAGTIAAEFPQVDLIRAPKNLGFAGGNNLAAKNSRGDWLLLLNPDTVVLDGAIQNMHAFAKTHLEASIFGGRTAFSDGSLNPKSCWRHHAVEHVLLCERSEPPLPALRAVQSGSLRRMAAQHDAQSRYRQWLFLPHPQAPLG